MNRLGVLTSGGDSPGMNPCIRAVVRCALNRGCEIFGIRRGYAGLMANDICQLGARDVGGIIQRGGTILFSSRAPEFRTEAGQRQALRNLYQNQIEGLIVIGGNGTLHGALALHRRGFPVIGVSSTIDNDIFGADPSIGVDTALNNILQVVDKIRDTASSHQRVFLIEVMGRDRGYLALMSGIAAGAEVILIPEVDTTLEEVAQTIADAYIRGKSFAIVLIAEGAKLKVDQVARYLEETEVGYEVRVTILGHMQRGGTASAFDRLLATRLGAAAVEALLEGDNGKVVCWNQGNIRRLDLEEALSQEPTLDLSLYDLAKVLAK